MTSCPVLDPDVLAGRAVDRLAVAPGQVIWIWASTHSLDLVDALAYRIRARGAFWTLRLISEPLIERLGRTAPEEVLGSVPVHELRWMDDVTAIIEVRDHGGAVPSIPPARRRALGTEWRALIDEAARRGCRRVTLMNPTPALAAACGLEPARLEQLCARAYDIDDARLVCEQQELAARLAGTHQVRITSPLGTDLALRLGGRVVHTDSDDLPRGEVYLAPLEDSAEGVAVIDAAFVRGRRLERLALTFSGGRVVQIGAPAAEDACLLEELLAAASGDADRIAELGFGLNPGAAELTGVTLLDEKIGGSVHIALGKNDHFGGLNHSTLHLDLVMLQPSVWLDDTQVTGTSEVPVT